MEACRLVAEIGARDMMLTWAREVAPATFSIVGSGVASGAARVLLPDALTIAMGVGDGACSVGLVAQVEPFDMQIDLRSRVEMHAERLVGATPTPLTMHIAPVVRKLGLVLAGEKFTAPMTWGLASLDLGAGVCACGVDLSCDLGAAKMVESSDVCDPVAYDIDINGEIHRVSLTSRRLVGALTAARLAHNACLPAQVLIDGVHAAHPDIIETDAAFLGQRMTHWAMSVSGFKAADLADAAEALLDGLAGTA